MAELSCERIDELAAAYSLGALDRAETRAVADHLRACRRPHAEAHRLRSTVDALASSTLPVTPRPELRERLMASVARTPQDAPQPVPTRVGWFDWLRPRGAQVFGVAAMAAVVLLAVVALQLQGRVGERDATLRAVASVLSSGGSLTRVDSAAGRGYLVRNGATTTLVASGVQPPAAGKIYEMWLIDASGVPTSAGVFTPRAGDLVVADVSGNLSAARTFAVTVEQGRVERPTSEPIIVVPLSAPQ